MFYLFTYATTHRRIPSTLSSLSSNDRFLLKTLLYSDASVFERREEGNTVRGEVVCLEKENLGGDEPEEARKRSEEEDTG